MTFWSVEDAALSYLPPDSTFMEHFSSYRYRVESRDQKHGVTISVRHNLYILRG